MAKTDYPGQHIPLHNIYGVNDCCLCRLEQENAHLREEMKRETRFACEMRDSREGWRHSTMLAVARVMELHTEQKETLKELERIILVYGELVPREVNTIINNLLKKRTKNETDI